MKIPTNDTILRYYPGTLAANAVVTLEAFGDYIFLQANSATDGTLKVSFDNNAEVTLVVGVILKLQKPFTRIFIRNTDTVSTTFALMCGLGNIDYKALVLSGTITTGPAQASTGTFAADLTAGAAAKVFTSATVKRVVIQNDVASTGPIYVGFDNTVSATKKVYGLAAGAGVEFTDFKGDIWVFGTIGTEKYSVSSW